MENKPLVIPKSMKLKGLKVYCNHCHKVVSEDCGLTGKSIATCKHGEKHKLKLVIHVPGTDNQRRMEILETRDINEGAKRLIELKNELKNESQTGEKKSGKRKEVIKEQPNDVRPILLIHALARYVGWLSNEGVPAHQRKERSEEHIKDVERALKILALCLKENEYNLATFMVDEINNEMVGKVFSFLGDKGFAPRTFNKYFSYYTSFLKWYIEEFDCPMRNYFEKVKRKNLNPKPEAITYKEYKALLERITPENGLKEYKDGVKPNRNLYRPWLADGFRLALETGRRREEIINLKWKDIKETNGIPYIVSEDYKVNRIQNRISESEKKYNYIPITESLQKLLIEFNQAKYSKTDNYILAPEIKISRKRVMADVLSRGFSHFYDQLNTGKKLTFKCLRKTYITNLEIFMGHGNTKTITGHSDDQVIERNYLDKKELAKAAHNFQIFPNEAERSKEIKEVRTTTKNNRELNDKER